MSKHPRGQDRVHKSSDARYSLHLRHRQAAPNWEKIASKSGWEIIANTVAQDILGNTIFSMSGPNGNYIQLVDGQVLLKTHNPGAESIVAACFKRERLNVPNETPFLNTVNLGSFADAERDEFVDAVALALTLVGA